MLTGVPLFEGKSVRSTFAERIVGDNLVRNRLAQTGVPESAIPSLVHAMAARIEQRIAHPREFFLELKATLAGTEPAKRKRDSFMSISYEEPVAGAPERAVEIPPHETLMIGDREIQLLDTEPLDLAVPTGDGIEARVRITLVWDRSGIRLNLKGLNCFIVGHGGGPTPALVTSKDGQATFMFSTREKRGEIRWSFGEAQENGRALYIDGQQMVVPYTRAVYAVALDVGRPHPIVVVCKR